MGRHKANPYDADQVVDETLVKKTPEEIQKARLIKISSDVMKAADLLKKISLYSHPKYKLTQDQELKIRDIIDRAYTVFNTGLIIGDGQSSIFD